MPTSVSDPSPILCQPTSIITASEDDASPVIMLWNLRNALAPEAILSGHDKGILSLSWCKQDPNLLLSSGKDNRNILWNPNSREMLGEVCLARLVLWELCSVSEIPRAPSQYPASNNWIFQTGFCPRNPDIFASASFDGKINVFSLQTNRNFSECSSRSAHQQASESEDLFDNPSFLASSTEGDFSLQQPPKWLQRPVSATFGFGGLLTTTSNLSGASGKTQSATVHLRTVVTEPELMDRVRKLQSAAGSKEDLGVLCEERSRDAEGAGGEQDVAAWRALSSLFTANSRSELVSLLGFSKEEVSEKVAVAINKFKKDHGKDDLPKEAIEPPSTTVTFAEDTTSGDFSVDASSKEDSTASTASGGAGEVAGSEFSTGGLSDATKKTEAESEATEPSSSLFSDDDVGTPQTDAAPDFFSSMGTLRSALPSHVLVPHQPQQAESSAAATVGSAPSLAASEMLKVSTFKIYPSDESEVDNLITRALVLGDFQSAVSLCLSSERFADAILLAVRGGPELLAKTQKTYFERRTESLPYLRLFQSIVSDDLADVVQNADLTEWQEIFVVLCTFAKADEFNNLAEQLGQRLEHQYRVAAGSEDSNVARQAKDHRRNATLCFLAAKKLERIVTIWADEMREEEESLQAASSASSRYTAHAKALQSFIEKVSVFQGATDYIDNDFASPTESEAIAESGARSYKLSTLYERYFEYADLLATQGLVQAAAKYVQLTPADFRLEGTSADPNAARERFLAGASVSAPATTTTPNTSASAYAKPAPVATLFAQAPAQRQPPPVSTSFKPSHGSRASASGRNARASISINGNSPFIAVAAPTPPVVTPGGPSPAQSVYSPYPAASSAPYQISSPHGVAPQTGGYNNYGTQSNYGAQQSFGAPSSAGIPPPPRPVGTPGSQTPPPLLPAAARRDIPGWNDAPPSKASAILRPFSAANKAGPITSPFPNSPGMAPPPMSPGVTGPAHQQQNNGFFPPPRGSTPQAAPPPPPPSRGASQVRPLPPPIAAPSAPPPRAAPPPAARPAPPPGARAPPRVTSPLSVAAPQAAVSARSPPPSAGPYAPPPGSQPSAAPLTGHGAPAPPPAKAQASPAPPAPPAAPKYPPGDRSHIPTANIPIFEQIQFLFEHVRSLPPPNVSPNEQLAFDRQLNLHFDFAALLSSSRKPPRSCSACRPSSTCCTIDSTATTSRRTSHLSCGRLRRAWRTDGWMRHTLSVRLLEPHPQFYLSIKLTCFSNLACPQS